MFNPNLANAPISQTLYFITFGFLEFSVEKKVGKLVRNE